jgi:hypothetical protein
LRRSSTAFAGDDPPYRAKESSCDVALPQKSAIKIRYAESATTTLMPPIAAHLLFLVDVWL